jgi:hypothetical protein
MPVCPASFLKKDSRQAGTTKSSITYGLLSVIVSLMAVLIVVPAYAIDGTALLKQVDRNLNPETYESYRSS